MPVVEMSVFMTLRLLGLVCHQATARFHLRGSTAPGAFVGVRFRSAEEGRPRSGRPWLGKKLGPW